MLRNQKLRTLCECAVLIALSLTLSFLKIKLWANGGSIDVVMVPLVILAVRFGPLWGVGSGMAFGLLKCLVAGNFGWGLLSVIFDYVLAYGAVGLAGLFYRKRNGLVAGAAVGGLVRFIVHFISGVTIYAIAAPTELFGSVYESAIWYSLVYNGSYMAANIVLAVIVCAIISMPLRKYSMGGDITRG